MVVHECAIKNIARIRIAHFEDVNPVVHPVGYGTARHGEHRFKLILQQVHLGGLLHIQHNQEIPIAGTDFMDRDEHIPFAHKR